MPVSSSTTPDSLALPKSIDRPALIHALCALIWIPQAGLLAWSVSVVQQGGGMHRLWLPALAIVGLSMLRALLEAWAAAQLHDSARSCLSRWRQQIVSVLATRSPVDTNRTGAGAAASILAEQAEAILPWLTRYRSAMWKARVVPFLLLIPIAWFSWISALILLAAGKPKQ